MATFYEYRFINFQKKLRYDSTVKDMLMELPCRVYEKADKTWEHGISVQCVLQ